MGGLSSEHLDGIKVKEPVFNLDAVWISKDLKEDALMKTEIGLMHIVLSLIF
jgi:flagellar biosynthesis protein FlhA